MTNRFRKGVLPLAIASLLAVSPLAFAQNVTSSAVTGRIVNASGQPVADATVTIVHVPSGTTKVVTTNASGRYNAKGLRVGGPYDITVTKPGLTEGERDQVFLQLGQTSAVNLILQSPTINAQQLGTVIVRANALSQIFSPANKGLGTNISERELDAMPTPGRSIEDIARLDPRVVISDRSEGKISALGMNYRYNNITVDSVGVNDPFGLNSNGLPTSATPISQDTIAEYNISVANYDVTNRRGLGANINAVTKSGTNKFHGSVYYVFQNQDMIGKKVDGEHKGKYQGFDRRWTAGATLGGPIIKDNLFFFVNYEKQEQIGKSTSSWGPEGSSANNIIRGLTASDLQAVRDAAAGWGMKDLGNFTGGNSNLQDKRYLVKLDWNINNDHRASFSWSKTKEFQPFPSGGSSDRLVLSSNWHVTSTDNTSYALHFYDTWSDNFSSTTALSYAHFKRIGGPFNGVYMPDVTVHIGNFRGPEVEFGTNYSYQANAIDTKTWFGSWVGTYFAGNHAFKFGFDYERDKKFNLFLQDFMGSYEFDSVDDLINGTYFEYFLKSPADDLTLADTAAAFKLNQLGLFVQDTWQVNDNLSLQYGVRVDIPKNKTKPIFNPTFAAAGFTTPTGTVLTTNQYRGNKTIIEPRVSFNYAFDTKRLMQLRGGFGRFVTNPPAVWIGNIYTNTGMTVDSFTCGPTQRGCDENLPAFSPDPHNQNKGSAKSGQMTVNTLDPGFQLPSAWKFSLAYDAELPWWGMVATVAYEHVDQQDAIWYQDLNLGAPTGTLPDGRNTYYTFPTEHPSRGRFGDPDYVEGQFTRSNANQAFSSDIINLAESGKGKTNNFTVMLRKPFQNNWSASIGATFNRTTDVNPGISSVAVSSYKQAYITNANENVASLSNYNTELRVIASLTWRHAFFGHYYTSVSAFYSGRTGHPYSWIFGNDANGDSFVNDLVFVPEKGQVEFKDGTPQKEIDQFYAYIANHRHLRESQGSVFRRNGARAPWNNQLDVSFSQEVPGLFRGSKGEIRLDIRNFLNLLNSHWGIVHRADFPGKRELADFYGVDPTTNKYIYDITGSAYTDNQGNYAPFPVPIYDDDFGTGDLIQRWSVQVTLRYKF